VKTLAAYAIGWTNALIESAQLSTTLVGRVLLRLERLL
jgi:hypothetical protein